MFSRFDHTKIDVQLEDAETGLSLGRAWIAFAMDRCTRMIVGVYISFEPPSLLTVLGCIKNAVLPKDYIAEWNFDNPWPAYGRGLTYVLDRAMENLSSSTALSTAAIGSDLIFAPRACVAYKRMVERGFRRLNEDVIHELPGTTYSNPIKK